MALTQLSQVDLGGDNRFLICEIVLAGTIVFLEVVEIVFSLGKTDDGTRLFSREAWMKVRLAWRYLRDREGHLLIISTLASITGCIAISVEDTETARFYGWVRVSLSVGASCSWLALLSLACIPFQGWSTYVNVVFDAMLTDVLNFFLIFTPVVISFTTGINALLQPFPVWTTRWASWWLTFENLLLLSFTQEPPDIYEDDPMPSSIIRLFGDFKVSTTLPEAQTSPSPDANVG